jgi:gamma-glutamyl:cysteine ligase YbdK (ATP-grasp superfamily)
MGQFLDKDYFTKADFEAFRVRLHEQVEQLQHIINAPGFSEGEASLGAELELYIVDSEGLPSPKNMQLLDMLKHPLLTEELNKFNLEFNLSPVAAKGKPFSAMTNEVAPFLTSLKASAKSIDTQIAMLGILPTLTESHLQRDCMTDLPRYRALTNQLTTLKGEPFVVDINGVDSLKTHCNEVTLEGANTSFQVHLKVPAERFADLYNAVQLTNPLVLALAGNSPTFLGKELWHETRIALFKQSIDNRIHALTKWRQPARVSFGQGWVRQGAWELFAQSVALYQPILPYIAPTNAPFAELNLHHGTVWSWNRAVFEPKHGGHLRIEYRSLPAGPTVIDMMANAALSVGLTQGLSHQIPSMLPKIPFEYAEYNFYRAAQDGLNANILWPSHRQNKLQERPISEVIKNLLPLAADGLVELGVDRDEIDTLLGVIEHRLSTRQTGSSWQIERLHKHQAKYDKAAALGHLLKDYMALSDSEEPVSRW